MTLFGPAERAGTARVAVERGVDRYPDGLTYAVPRSLVDLRPGDRVIVPLGRGDTRTAGYVIDRHADLTAISDAGAPPVESLKEVISRDPGAISLPPALVELARWISAYYVCPTGLTLAGMLPAAVRKQTGLTSRRFVELAPAAPVAEAAPSAVDPTAPIEIAPPKNRALTATQRNVLEHLRRLGADGSTSSAPIESRLVVEALELGSEATIRTLARRGLVRITQRSTVEAAWHSQLLEAPTEFTPSPAQRSAIAAIGATLGQGFSAHLLHGVTGSGKTEVYLRLFERTIAAGKIALYLVPEIALTPQTGARVMARFPTHRVAVLHSGLTAAQRHQQWALAAQGDAAIVLGARSAVFAPIPAGRLGLIVVDEEHDSSYKQDSAPRYHGRDVAVRRAQLEACPVVLGSATPSLESWHNATVRQVFSLHRLPERAPGLSVPRVEIIDFVEERRRRSREGDRRVHLIGPTLEGAIGHTLASGGQVLLLLNRRGYANYIACPDVNCGWMQQCSECDATMVCHVDVRVRGGMYLRCHHCQGEQLLRETCPQCAKRTVVFGLGTQRVEEELLRKFALLAEAGRMARVDSDTMERSTDLHGVLSRFGSGELRLLIGTQMIAKGLDFPGVRLVGVINADTALSIPDFRASERTFQLVSQVAGRCGRGAHAGLALIQTFQPHFEAIVRAAQGDFDGFAARELAERSEARLPPSTRLARIVVRHEDRERGVATASEIAEGLRSLLPGLSGGSVASGSNPADLAKGPAAGIHVIGPNPCTIGRIAGRHRQEVTLVAPDAAALQRLLAAGRARGIIRPGEEVAVDVDPQALG